MTDNWFTIEKIDEDTMAISEYGHWEQVHSYLVLGRRQAALIDTGLGIGHIGQVVSSLTDLPPVVLTTHAHWDHIGGHACFERYFIHRDDSRWLSDGFPLSLEQVRSNLMREPCVFPAGFSFEGYTLFQGEPAGFLEDRQVIELGGRELSVLHTPGHSPGHVCLFEEKTGYLFSGDLIYRGKLDIFYQGTSPQDFKRSLEKISALPIHRILPGHYSLNIPPGIVEALGSACKELETAGTLCHGSGLHDFGMFTIHL